MRFLLSALFVCLLFATETVAKCSKEDVCSMTKTMSPFSILDKCPSAGPLIVECKKIDNKTAKDLLKPEFLDNGDGTITDKVNKLLWIKNGLPGKGMSFNDALKMASGSNAANKIGWRLPTLSELKTLLYQERVKNASGKKAWINPVFDDGRGTHYWTTTTCEEVTFMEDRYQKKICREGSSAVWLLHFNIGAIFWQFTTKPIYHVWLVQNL